MGTFARDTVRNQQHTARGDGPSMKKDSFPFVFLRFPVRAPVISEDLA